MPRTFLTLAVLLGSISFLAAQEAAISYPETRRIEHYDDYHGTKVHDPYRWLEDDVRESASAQKRPKQN